MLNSGPVKMTEKLDTCVNTDDALDANPETITDEKPHLLWCSGSDPERPLLDCLLGFDGIDILTIKVENHSQLKQMAIQIFQSLKHVVEDGEQVATLAAQVKNMLKCPMFIRAFLEANKEDQFMIGDVDFFSNAAQDQQRLENLKTDSLLGQILQETETTSNIRGVLKIIMAYWSDKDFFNKLCEEIKEAYEKNVKPKEEVVEWEERIIDLDFPSDIEGLKAAMATKYHGDDYERICEEIDRNRHNFESTLSFHCFGRPDRLGLDPPPQMTWLSILWRNGTFYLRAVGYGSPPTIPVCND